MKYRIKLTIEDYYTYVGTDPSYSLRKRVLESIPQGFKNPYNIKVKKLAPRTSMILGYIPNYHTYYRVQFSVDMDESEIVKILSDSARLCRSARHYSYKKIKSPWCGKPRTHQNDFRFT